MGNKYRSVLASGGVQPTGNAQPADVLATKTFSNADGIDKTGTMVNNGAVSGTATPSQPYTIPAGYHNGSGSVSASGKMSLTNGQNITVNSGSTGNMSCTVGKQYLLSVYDGSTVNAYSITGGTIDNEEHIVFGSSYQVVTLIFTATSANVTLNSITGGARTGKYFEVTMV